MTREPMSIREQLRRANPQVDGPTYRYVKGDIDEAEFRRQMDALPTMLLRDSWHAEPVRAAHHRRVGFAWGLLAGIAFVVGLLVLRAWL